MMDEPKEKPNGLREMTKLLEDLEPKENRALTDSNAPGLPERPQPGKVDEAKS